MTAIGWYGPLIDLSKASSYTDDFVQLLVFVHRSTPIQYKSSKGGEVIRTDIQVGDDTLPFFHVSLWQKQMGLMALAGDIVLLQNVKITRFGGGVEAKTVQYSSLLCLVHPYESLVSKGLDDLMMDCRMGVTAKEKLRKVIKWVQGNRSTLHNHELHGYQKVSRNWKVQVEEKTRDCLSLSEVSRLTLSCKVTFYASVAEIFLPLIWRSLGESEKERMFISRRLGDNNITEDLICTGCEICGSPLDLKNSSATEQSNVPLYCSKSSNRLHKVSLIYRPFMLYVWDKTEHLPLSVKNKAAEILFGSISAGRVHECYRSQQNQKANDKSLEMMEKSQPNLYLIWLILLKVLLQQGKNSHLKFEIFVNDDLDREDGRFEMVSVLMPCPNTSQGLESN